jgi:hypothetical protein
LPAFGYKFVPPSESRSLQFLHEFVEAVSRRSRREKLLDLHLQNLREIEKRFVVNVRESRFDFGNAAATDVEAGDSRHQTRRQIARGRIGAVELD